MNKDKFDNDYLLNRYNHCIQEVTYYEHFIDYLKLLDMSDRRAFIIEVSRLNELINRNNDEAKRPRRSLIKRE